MLCAEPRGRTVHKSKCIQTYKGKSTPDTSTRRYQDTPVVDTTGTKDNSNKISQSNRNFCIVESVNTPILVAEARILLKSSRPKHKIVEIQERMRYLAQKQGPEMPHTAKAVVLTTKGHGHNAQSKPGLRLSPNWLYLTRSSPLSLQLANMIFRESRQGTTVVLQYIHQ